MCRGEPETSDPVWSKGPDGVEHAWWWKARPWWAFWRPGHELAFITREETRDDANWRRKVLAGTICLTLAQLVAVIYWVVFS